MGVLNTAHWPICALNIRQKKIFVVSGTLALGPRGQWQIPIWAGKNETGQYSVSVIIWVLGVVGAANYTP